MGRAPTKRSALTEVGEQALVPGDNPRGLCRLGLQRPVSLLGGSAEDDCIGAGEHVKQFITGVDRQVIDVEIRGQEYQLAFDRCQFVITEKCLGTEAGAIENDGLLKCEQLRTVLEIADCRRAPAR